VLPGRHELELMFITSPGRAGLSDSHAPSAGGLSTISVDVKARR